MPDSQPRTLRCGLLTTFGWDFAATYILSTPEIEFVTISPSVLGLPAAPNPFELSCADRVDVVVVSSYWYQWLANNAPASVREVFRRLEDLAEAVVGLDAADDFALGFPPSAIDHFAIVLKAQGLYRDRDLYNYEVGPRVPGSNWTEKTHRRAETYSDEALGKLRLSIPCIMRDVPALRADARALEARASVTMARNMFPVEVRARNATAIALDMVQNHAPVRFRTSEVHCFGGLNHVQRLETLRYVAEFSGLQGLSSVPDTELAQRLIPDVGRALEEAKPFLRPALSRTRFLLTVCRHKIVVAPTGYGEITFRHGEALHCGAALVCQSLDHVETMFEFRNGHNVVFCRPDQSDLGDRVQELLADDGLRRQIARAGRREFREWLARWREHMRRGVEAPLREALGETGQASDAYQALARPDA